MTADPVLTTSQRGFLASAMRAVLATIAPDGRPRIVPICFVLDPESPVLYSPLDEKPKGVRDPRDLGRVRDVLRDPRVTVLVDTWDEDWSRLGWLRCEGTASLLEPVGKNATRHRAAVVALLAKYPQYETHDLAGRPMIRIVLERTTDWGRLAHEAT
jgi:PPOX class probable F420-dependent enzyme